MFKKYTNVILFYYRWGSVSYLTHSDYGRCNNGICENVDINSYYYRDTDTNERFLKTGCGPQSEEHQYETEICNAYATKLGKKASTTGNIYGIYDMAGGRCWRICNGKQDSYNRTRLGDATGEIILSEGNRGGWTNTYTNVVNGSYSWYMRGSFCGDGISQNFYCYAGYKGSNYFSSTRAVLLVF